MIYGLMICSTCCFGLHQHPNAPPAGERLEFMHLYSSSSSSDLFVTYTIIQRVYNQQWNVSQVRSMDSANIIEYNTMKYT